MRAMANKFKKTINLNSSFLRFILSPKRVVFLSIAILIFTIFTVINTSKNVFAASGINRTINFQGKVVNKDGTNVADGQYTFVFNLYDAAGGGANPWTETQNNVQVTAGIFRVSLGSVTTFASAGVDFNTDNLYLGITFNGDGEMTPRVRFAAVPYAINAEKVAGLTVTNTTGTLTIPNSKVVQFGGAFTTGVQDLTLTLSGGTNVTLPTTGTLATLDGIENLSNKTFTTSLTISGVTTDLTTGTNEDLSIIPNGSGKVNINTTSGLASFDVRANSVVGGTLAVASISGKTAFATLVADNTGLGDIFTASTGGVTKFTVKNNGQLFTSNYTANGGILYTQTTGILAQTTVGNSGDCLKSIGGGTPTWGSCGGAAGTWTIDSVNGVHYPINSTLDLLIGGTSTQSAVFSVLGVAAGTNPSASVSATQGANAGKGIYMSGDGSLQSVRNNPLTLGGSSTGDIFIRPLNGSGMVRIIHGTTGTGGLILQDSEADATNKVGRLKFATYSNASAPYTGLIGVSDSTSNQVDIGGGSGSENSATYIRLRTGETNATLTGIERLRVDNLGNVGIGNFLEPGISSAPVNFKFQVDGATTGNALVGFNYTGVVDQNILVASYAGVLKFALGGSGTVPVASISANTSFAGLVIDNKGLGDIFTASTGGVAKFTVKNNGQLYSSNYTANGGILYTQTTGILAQTVVGNSGDCLKSAGGGTPTWGTCIAGGASTWVIDSLNGVQYPTNNTLDLLIGGTSTASAKFSVLGIAGTVVPTASVSAQNALKQALVLGGDGSIQSVRNNTLTLGGATTGDIQFKPGNISTPSLFLATAGNVGIGTTAPGATLDVVGSILLGANSTIDTRASGTLSVGTAANTTGLTLGRSGNTTTFNSTSWTAVPTISGLVTGTLGFSVATGQSYTGAGTVTLSSAVNNDLTLTAQGSGNVILTSDADTGLKIGAAGNTIAPLSVSGGIGGNAAFILNQTNTGDIFSASSSGLTKFVITNSGSLGLNAGQNNSTLLSSLDVRANPTSGGTISIASISGKTSFAALTVDNKGVGDIFTASSSGLNRFVITQGGNVGIGIAIPQAKLDIKDTASTVSVSVTEKITLAADRTFVSDTGNWTASVNPENWAIYGNVANKSASGTTPIILANTALDSAPVAGNTYLIKFDYTTTASSSGYLTPSFGGVNGVVVGSGQNESQLNVYQVITASGNGPLTFTPSDTNWYGTIDTVSIRLVSSASSVALRVESSDGFYNPLEIRVSGDTQKSSFIGNGSGRFNTGNQNAAVGYQTLYNNVTGTDNTATGFQALYNNTSASYNSAFGSSALSSNLTGANNTATGYRALYLNKFGSNNTALGSIALQVNTTGSHNTAVGLASLWSNTTGNNNAAVGNNSLVSNTTGGYNTAVGYVALQSNVTGSYNTALGYGADTIATNLTNTTAIGYNAKVNASNSLILGGTGQYSVSVGIGTQIPTGVLDVQGGFMGGNAALIVNQTGVNTNDIFVASSSGVTKFIIANSGNVGIGTTLPNAPLHINAGNFGGNAALIVNQIGVNTNDILAASASGVTKFVIKNDGTASTSASFTIDGAGGLQATKNQTLTIGGNTTGDIQFKPGNSSTSLYLASNGAFGVNGSYGVSGQCLITNGSGAAPAWAGCASGGSGNWWLQSAQGTLAPGNLTLDMLWGGTTTASATFRLSGATIAQGTVAAASVSANTSFAGLVVDNKGSGQLLTASSSGMTRFTIYNGGDVVIGNTADAGYRLDVQGSVRIGNNTTTDDIVKDSSTDWATGTISTADGVNTVTTSGDQLKLVTDIIGAGGTPTAPAADQNTGTNITTGSVAFQRPDKKFIVYVGGATTSRIYDPSTGLWNAGPGTSAGVSMGAGARAFQRQNGSFLMVHGGGASTTTIYQPGGIGATSADMGTTTAGPNTSAAVGAGSLIIRRTDGKVLVIHGNNGATSSVYDPTAAIGTTSLLGTFIAGPVPSANVTTGSFAIPRPNGSWLVGHGGAQTTSIYDPSSTGPGNGGTFIAGPTWTSVTATNAGAGAHTIQLPDGKFLIFLGGGSALTLIYDPVASTFSGGSSLASGDVVNTGAHSFQRSDGKWVVVIGGNSRNLQLYDPTNVPNGGFTQLAYSLGVTGLQGATGAGAGALTFQRPDGKYIVVHGAGNGGAATQLTTLYDAGWNTTGTWTSEDISSTKISTYSAMIWSANPQSANNNARLDSETINFSVKTGDSSTSLSNNAYRSLQDSGDLIRSYGNANLAKIQITFTVPIRSYVTGATGYISQSNIWMGEGGTYFRRSFIQPTVNSVRIQNPLVSYGDPSGQGDPAFGRNFATGSATLEGVVTDNSNRLTLATLRNFPTATASAGFIIASASANLGGSAGAGAHTLERNNGQFITILGGGLSTTRIYDVDTSSWSAGPSLPNPAGAGAHSFLLPDGRFFIVLGGGAAGNNKTAIFDPQVNGFIAGPNLYGNVGAGANTFQRPDGFFVILNGGATPYTNILDPFTMAVTQGPFTIGATPNVGLGALNIRRPDGRILIVLGNSNAIATATNVYDPATNSFSLGPALTGGTVGVGGNAVQLYDGRVLLFKTSTATSNYLDPIQDSFAQAGPGTTTANGAGSFLIPRTDGKILRAIGGGAATTSIVDTLANTALSTTSAPTLPCNINTGGHVFQRQTGEYVVICGSGASTFIIDAGWNLGGTYTTEQIQEPLLSGTTSLFWKNAGQGEITVKYRTATSSAVLGITSWKDAQASGTYVSPGSTDTFIQLRFDLQGEVQDLPGAKTRVWLASDAGGAVTYYRSVQAPILQYWKLMNIQDPTILTLTSGGNNVFRFSSDGQAFTSDNGAWNSGGADLAERYSSQDSLQAGEVVSIDRLHPQNTKRSVLPYDQNAMGVVSTQPGFVAGAYTKDSYPIALVGRVPVKVSTENGEIKAGDYLTSASIPGYAMKATVAGRVIGQAMEDLTPDQFQDCPKFGAGNLTTTQCGTITVFVNLTSYNGQSVDVAVKDSGFVLKEEELPAISGVDFAQGTDARKQQEILGFLKTQRDNGQSIYTDKIAATQEIISPQIVTDLLIAKKIKAESIEGLEILTNNIEQLSSKVASGSSITNFSDKLNLLALNQQEFESQMASLSAKLDKMGAINLLNFAAKSTESSDLVMVNNFASYGTTTLSEVSVLDTMTIGSGTTLNLSQNSINTLGDDLNIQSLKQGAISFLGGLIRFDTDGKAKFAEDVSFEKNVAVTGVLSAHTVSSTELQLGQGETVIVSDTEVKATAAAGLVILKKNTDHIKINNPLVKDGSYIFITPKTRSIQQLFLQDQVAGESFTVGADSKADEDIKFNYLIVN